MCLSTTSGLTLQPESFRQKASFLKRKNQAMPRAEGWFKVHRGWMENSVFKDDLERLCWLWLIEKRRGKTPITTSMAHVATCHAAPCSSPRDASPHDFVGQPTRSVVSYPASKTKT